MLQNRLRMVTSAGVVTTLAGSGTAAYDDGTGTAASFNSPRGLAVSSSGVVYLADQGNNCIRAITAGVVTTWAGVSSSGYADGAATVAHFNGCSGVALDSTGL